MPKTVKMPDGRVISFPDSATDEQIRMALGSGAELPMDTLGQFNGFPVTKGMTQPDFVKERTLLPDEGDAGVTLTPEAFAQYQAFQQNASKQAKIMDARRKGDLKSIADQFGQNANVSLADMLGLPVDFVTAGLRELGIVSEDTKPFLGSENIKDIMRATGAGVDPREPVGGLEKFASTAGRNVGASVVPAAGLLKGAQMASQGASPFISLAQQAPKSVAAAEIAASTTSAAGEEIAKEIFPESKIAPVVGSLVGGVGPSMVKEAGRKLIQGGRAGAENITDTLDRMTRLGLDETASLGVASKVPALQAVESSVGRLPFGNRVRQVSSKMSEALGRKIEKLTGGRDLSSERAGRVIDTGLFGGEGFVKRFQAKSNELYDKLGAMIPSDTQSTASNTKSILEKISANVPGAEATSEVLKSDFIKKIAPAFMSDIEKGSIPYSALNDLRMSVGRKLSGGDIIADAPRAELKRIYAALSSDIDEVANAIGPEAARASKRAAQFYKAGIERVDNVLKKFSNKVDFSSVYKSVVSGAEESGQKLGVIRRSLNPVEWNVVADTMIKRLGRARPGSQDDLGEVFSSETFLTNWNKLADSAKKEIFAGRPGFRKDMDDIATIASQLRDASRTLANPSGTAGAAIEASSLIAIPAAAAIDPQVAIAVIGPLIANNAASRLMTNQRFVKWAAQTARMPAERLPGQIARIATQDIDDVDYGLALQEYLNTLQGGTND